MFPTHDVKTVDGARKLNAFDGEGRTLETGGVITLENRALSQRLVVGGVPAMRIV